MQTKKFSLALVLTFVSMVLISSALTSEKERVEQEGFDNECIMNEARVLRHVVLFKFKKGTSSEAIKKVENAFTKLPTKIPQIKGYEWGLNNSPEALDKGFTHCFLLTFNSEQDRSIYLPHPDHKAFGEVLEPHLEDVLVVDYWVSN